MSLSSIQKEELTTVNISSMLPLYHYVNIHHAFHVLFMRFMRFHMYCLWQWTCLFLPNKIFDLTLISSTEKIYA